MQQTWMTLLYSLFLLFLVLTGPSMQCSPGRMRGSSRRGRKMTPLVFKQHVPNVSENTLGASGLSEGPIKRMDPRFDDLVVNHNPDIIFKDEEGTGADRIMSQRCKDKLNTLAISVMNRWPGIRLRVTEAWDEDQNHHSESLHYEGRAVDITTSDRDTSKYGMLARLAIDAGFDWVYYQSRSHIHCSVKSDSSIASKTGGCFSGSGAVVLSNGSTKSMSELRIGDRALAMDATGKLVYSEVIMFLDYNPNKITTYYVIETSDNRTITLTPGHLIYVSESAQTSVSRVKTKFAGNVELDDFVYTLSAEHVDKSSEFDSVRASKVTRIQSLVSTGSYAPLTRHGSIVVDGVLASCYAMVDSQFIAHSSFAPVRAINDVTSWFSLGKDSGSDVSVPPVHGVHWYAGLLYDIGDYVLSSNYWFHL